MKIWQSKALSLQALLVVPFVLQIFGAVGLVGYLSFRNGQQAVNGLVDELMERTSDVMKEHMESYLSVPQRLNQLNAAAIRQGILEVNNPELMGQYFWEQMQVYDLTFVGIGLATGEGVGALRYDGETTTIDDWDSNQPNSAQTFATNEQGDRTELVGTYDYNHFSESWYTAPLEAQKSTWSDIYIWNSPYGPYLAASAGRPMYDGQDNLLGVIGADIHLLKLSDFLQRLDVSQKGTVFIMERDGNLIANSGSETPFTEMENELQRLPAIASPDPIIQSLAQQLQATSDMQTISQLTEFQFEVEGESHFVNVMPWQDNYGLDWLVVVSVPKAAFMAQIEANTRTTIMLCIAALIVASALGWLTARWITRPILHLNQASEAIAAGNLEQTVEASPIQELNVLSNSFNYMAAQLRDSFNALEASNEFLEERVTERTAELQNALKELQRSQAQLVQSEKMSSLGQLVAGVAHEINNPVNFIHGNLQHVREYTKDLFAFVTLYQQQYPHPAEEIDEMAEAIDLDFLLEDLPKMLASMKVGTDRIRQIVLSLRNFSRMDEAELKHVDIHEGIDSTLMILQHKLKAKSDRPAIEIIKDYADLPPVECYAGQLNQVFVNILTNAIDALEERHAERTSEEMNAEPNRITIRTSQLPHEWIEVAIADNGGGIPEAVKQSIFDPFFTTKPLGKGTGMGMSISYQVIVDKHDGKLECYSTPDQGTEFVIQIPLHQRPPQEVADKGMEG
ncbi:MAG: ATP-binding protein [Cyanobacteria bacterium P01_C01_bin.120]